MEEEIMKRIGIFEYDWSMYQFIKDFTIKLAEAGYSVDFFFKDWDIQPNYADTNDFDLHQNIRFFNFTTKGTKRQVFKRRFTRMLNKIAILLSFPRNDRPDEIIDPKLLNKSREMIGTSLYCCFIGIEKKGLIWAGILSEIIKCPLIYYSLELYIEDHPGYFRFFHLRNAEKKYHQLSSATIIQDSYRANALLKSNGIENTNVVYYPVSVQGNIVQDRSKYLQNKFNISDNKKIILYFGAIHKARFAAQIVNLATDLDEDNVLVIHGWGSKKYLDHLESISDRNRVIFSLNLVSENEIIEMVSSAHIGISLYKKTNANDRLTACSSSKMAYFAKCGVPFIAFDTESYRELLKSFACGELISAVNEVPQKVHKILSNYESYRQQAFLAYHRFYNLDANFSRVLPQIEKIMDDKG